MNYISLLRINNWIKNIFFLVPVFFAGEIFNQQRLIQVIAGIFFFSMATSSIYIINDYIDRDIDAKHPIKKLRPIAAGVIPPVNAICISIFLLVIALIGSYFIEFYFYLIVIFYFIMNLGYSFGLKNISIVDVIVISIGFIIRVQAGAILGGVSASMWLNLMIFLLALFMALGKRRDDVFLQLDSEIKMRKSIEGYNMEFLNVSITFICAIMMVCYLMYTISPEVDSRLNTNRLYYTSLFVLIGVLRYLQLIFVKNDSGSPVKIIYKDRFLQITIILWIMNFYFLIYAKDIVF
jgi:decaprenyl-phosphate phosphoribosyltransferase